MSDEYQCVVKGKLKLKNDSQIKKQKKKTNKSKDLKKKEEIIQETFVEEKQIKLTKAELGFKQQQEKMRNKRIMEKASTTHKKRVEKFNQRLDELTEHFDIPKVSWTK